MRLWHLEVLFCNCLKITKKSRLFVTRIVASCVRVVTICLQLSFIKKKNMHGAQWKILGLWLSSPSPAQNCKSSSQKGTFTSQRRLRVLSTVFGPTEERSQTYCKSLRPELLLQYFEGFGLNVGVLGLPAPPNWLVVYHCSAVFCTFLRGNVVHRPEEKTQRQQWIVELSRLRKANGFRIWSVNRQVQMFGGCKG